MLSTLQEAMRGHGDVRVRLYNNESRQPPPPIAGAFGRRLTHQFIKSHNPSVSHACHHVYVDMISDAFASCSDDYVVNIDSDCCVHPEFITRAKEMIATLPHLGMASLYSEGNHPEPTEVVERYYHRREHVSMTASIISRKVWEKFPKPTAADEIRAFWEPHIKNKGHAGGIDGALSAFAHDMDGVGCFSTIQSYVDHIGAVGQYSAQDSGGVSNNHRARRFNP